MRCFLCGLSTHIVNRVIGTVGIIGLKMRAAFTPLITGLYKSGRSNQVAGVELYGSRPDDICLNAELESGLSFEQLTQSICRIMPNDCYIISHQNVFLHVDMKQRRFQGEITLSVPGGREVVALSFWDQNENAQAYHSSGHPEVEHPGKIPRWDSAPLGPFDVVGSTLQKIAAHLSA